MIQNNLLIENLNAYYSENKVMRRAYDLQHIVSEELKYLIYMAHGKKSYRDYPKVQYLGHYCPTLTYTICFSLWRIVILLTTQEVLKKYFKEYDVKPISTIS